MLRCVAPVLLQAHVAAGQARPLNEREMEQRAENLLEKDTSTKSTAMGVIPFTFAADLKAQFSAFNAGSVNWVEMVLSGEEFVLGDHATVQVRASSHPLHPSITHSRHGAGERIRHHSLHPLPIADTNASVHRPSVCTAPALDLLASL